MVGEGNAEYVWHQQATLQAGLTVGVSTATGAKPMRTMFRTLKRAGEGHYRDQVASACFTHAAAHGDVSLCLYDVTTLYFEAEKEDDLRKVGYSKERRVDPQIVVGLLEGPDRFPAGDRLLRRQSSRDVHDSADHPRLSGPSRPGRPHHRR